MKTLVVQRSSKELVDLTEATAVIGGICDVVEHQIVPRTAIASDKWPKAVTGTTKQAYEQARQEVTFSTHALGEVAKAATKALVQVFHNYSIAEDESSIESKVKKNNDYKFLSHVDPPPGHDIGAAVGNHFSQGSNLLSGAAITATGGRHLFKAFRGAPYTTALEQRLRVAASAATMILPATVLATNIASVWPNIKDYAPFDYAGGNWYNTSLTLNSALGQNQEGEPLNQQGDLLSSLALKDWHGTAKETFVSYMNREFVPAVQELSKLTMSLDDLLGSVGMAMENYQANQEKISLITLGEASLALASSIVPAGMFLSAALATAYVATTDNNRSLLGNQGGEIAKRLNEVTKRANALADRCLTSRPDPRAHTAPPKNKLLQRFTAMGLDDPKTWHDGLVPGA